jgi:hypothetical protein
MMSILILKPITKNQMRIFCTLKKLMFILLSIGLYSFYMLLGCASFCHIHILMDVIYIIELAIN